MKVRRAIIFSSRFVSAYMRLHHLPENSEGRRVSRENLQPFSVLWKFEQGDITRGDATEAIAQHPTHTTAIRSKGSLLDADRGPDPVPIDSDEGSGGDQDGTGRHRCVDQVFMEVLHVFRGCPYETRQLDSAIRTAP